LQILVHPRGDAYAAGRREAFDAHRDVDAFAEDVVAVMRDVADIDAEPEHDTARRSHVAVARRHLPLHRDRALDRVHGRGELDQQAVAGGLDDTAAVARDRGVDQLAAMGTQRRLRAGLVDPDHAAVAGDVRREDGREATRRR